MIFVVCQLQELGRKEDVQLYTCFVDLQKAYDSIDCSHLWVVLARFRVPPVMVDIMSQFHNGMPACVRLDGGKVSEWFEVCQGLRLRYVFAPILLNFFKDPQVEPNLVSIRSIPLVVGDGDEIPWTSTTWIMLCAYDAAVVEVCRAYGLTVAERTRR